MQGMGYCANCGNKVIASRLTVKNVLSEFSNQFFNLDNKLVKTFIHLLTKPEAVVNMFIGGARKTYMNVISYLALSVTLIGIHIYLLMKFLPESTDSSPANSFLSPELEKELVQISEIMIDYSGLLAVAFIPITSIATYLIFQEKKYNYAEHIVLNMYGVAQYSIVMLFITAIFLLFGVENIYIISSLSSISYIYLGYLYFRLFNLKIFEAIWKTLASQILYTLLSALIVGFILLLIILFLKLIQ